jgi:mercuric reductase
MSEVRRLRLRIGGMSCTGCEGHVVRALEGIGATEVSASHRRGDARCAVPGGVADSTITGAVQAAGYRVLGVEDVAPVANDGNCCG